MPNKNAIDPETSLTPRQRSLLFAIIRDYCDSGIGVGSKELKDKYGFEFSSATIRGEISKLRDLGYLYQPFTNSSSQPTEKAFKVFINQLIVGLQVTSRQQQDLKKQIMDMEDKQVNLHKEISRLLAVQTGAVGFSVNQNTENISGIKNLLLTNPSESKVSDILDFLDNLDSYKGHLLNQQKQLPDKRTNSKEKNDLTTFIGGENPILPLGDGYAMVATEVYVDNQKTVIGLITPVHVLARKKNLELMQTISKVLSKKDAEE